MSKFTDRIDMRFQYVPSGKTDIRKTIAREKKRLAEEAIRRQAEAEAVKVEVAQKVRRIAK